MPRKKLGEMLIEAGVIDDAQLRAALGHQKRWGHRLGRILIDLGMLSEDDLVGVLSRQLGIPAVTLLREEIDSRAAKMLDEQFCRDHSVLAFHYDPAGKFLDVAMEDPTDSAIFDRLRVETKCNIRPHLCGPIALEQCLRRAFGAEAGAPPLFTVSGMQMRVDEPMIEFDGATSEPSVEEPDVFTRQTLSPIPADQDPLIEKTRQPQHVFDATAEVAKLQSEVRQLRGLLERDEQVLRKLMSILIEKRVISRDELVRRLSDK